MCHIIPRKYKFYLTIFGKKNKEEAPPSQGGDFGVSLRRDGSTGSQ